MRSIYKILTLKVIIGLASITTLQAQKVKLVNVRLTGTLPEKATLVIGDSRREVMGALPYDFSVPREELPMTVHIESPNYDYHAITINKKEQDGHYYIVHSERKQVNTFPQQATPVTASQVVQEDMGLDWSKGVNVVPYTGKKAERTFALIIANEEYEMAAHVEMANYDGEVFKAYCEKTLGLGEHNIKYYPNATYGKMNRAFREITEIANAFEGNINLIFYYAGHGIPDNASKDAYIMPVDADGTDVGVCYSLKKLYEQIEHLHLNQCVVFLDACFSGAQRDGDMIVAARSVAIKPNASKPKSSTVVFSAVSGDETAFSYKKEKHGLFTYFLLKKLQESKGDVRLGELSKYLQTSVKQNSIMVNGKVQTPTVVVSDEMGDRWEKLQLVQ